MKISSVLIVLQAGNGDYWLQQRAHDDEDYPGCWDFAAGGSVDGGEDADSAAARELQEELGIRCELTAGETCWLVDEHCRLYHAVYDGDFRPNHEVAAMRRVSQAALAGIPVTAMHPQFAAWLGRHGPAPESAAQGGGSYYLE